MEIKIINVRSNIRKRLLILIMRTFIFLLCTTVFGFSSDTGFSQEKIVIDADKEVTIHEVFKLIKDQTKYRFIYPEALFEKTPNVKLKKGTINLNQLLKQSLLDSHLKFELSENNIVISKEENIPLVIKKQDIISGHVTDDAGLPLAGANVIEKGTTNGVMTDFDGNFKLNIQEPNSFLVVSFIGFITQEIPINNQDVFNIQLLLDTASLDEVVIIGYGEQSRAKVIGAVGKLDNRNLEKVAASSIEQQIAGKMSGVVVNQTNGQPGAASQIIIRGTGTLTAGTNPLIVVDGFPLTEGSSLNAINPNDIEDISILKDAASAAIYGSRAANGVILVTTKKGKENSETSISLDVYWGMQQESSGVEMVDAYQFAQFLTEARNWGYVSKDPINRNENDPNEVRVTKRINGKNIDGRELFLNDLQPYLDGSPGLINTNWKNEAFRSAPISNYALSMSGGNEKTKYYASLGFFDQEGVVVGTGLKRYSASFSLQNKVNDKISIGFNLKPSYTSQDVGDQSSRSSGALALIALNSPFYRPYNPDGTLNISEQIINETRKLEGVGINGTPVENLLATATEVKNNRVRFRTFGNIFLDAELIEGLKYRLSMGGDADTYTEEYYYPSDIGAYRSPAPRSDADGSETKQNKYNYLIENTLNYKFNLDRHSFNVLAGYTFQKENSNYTKVTGTGYADDNIQSIAGASSYSANSSSYIWTLESYLGRIQYDYDSKYLLSAAIRTDGSSRFGENNRWGTFPSVSAGWILSEEDFFPTSNLLNFAKISGSWGITGNNQIGNYSSQALVTNSNYVFGNNIVPGYVTTSAPNPDLGWEMASSFNFGLDLSFFQRKLNLGLAYYKTNTKDLLLDVPVPQQTGYSNVLTNIGEMENRGFEFQLQGSNFEIGEVAINFNANLTTYENKVLALGPGQEKIATGTDQAFVTQIGRPIGEIFGYNLTGIYKTEEEISSSPHLDGTLIGDHIVVDTNGDGKIDINDKVSKGTFAPDLTYGFGSEVVYKNFSLSFNFTGVVGRTLLDADLSLLTESGEGFGVPTTYYFKNRYHPENNPNGFLGRPNFGNFSNARKQTQSSAVLNKNNGDYFRLRDVRIAYDVPKSLLNKINSSTNAMAQIYLSGNNLFTITDYRGWNPDGTSGNILTSGYNNSSNYPISRTFLMGIKITY